MKKWLWQEISVLPSGLKNFHLSLLLMKILSYLLTHSPWLLNHLLNCFLQSATCYLVVNFFSLVLSWFCFPRGSLPILTVNLSSQRKQRQVWSTLFSRRGSSNILIMVKQSQTNRNYLIWLLDAWSGRLDSVHLEAWTLDV